MLDPPSPAVQREVQSADFRAGAIARRFGSLAHLSPAEIEFLNRVGSGPVSRWDARTLIDRHVGDRSCPQYLISGWATRVRELKDNRRQLVQLLLPGDALTPELQVLHPLQAVQCLTPALTVAGGAITVAVRDPENFPGIAAATELAAAHDRAHLIEQAARLGRQTAYERMASLFMELHHRCLPIGLVHADGFAFPLTQEAIGDLLGLSLVHVNRTLQSMRREDLICLKKGWLTLLNVQVLTEVGEYKPPQLEWSGSAANTDGTAARQIHFSIS